MRKLHQQAISRRRVLGSLAAAASLTTVMLTAVDPAPAVLGTDRCGFTTLIAVRGSDEAAESGTSNGGRTYASGGWGETLGEFVGHARREPNVPVYAEAINYPAVILDWSNPQSQNYVNSVNIGVSNLRAEIESLASSCPHTNIVLAGYSQGAHVITRVLSDATAPAFPHTPLTPNARAHITAVALFASPSFTPGETYNWSGSGAGRGIFSEPAGSLGGYTKVAWIAPAYSTKAPLTKVRSYCLPGDMFCQGNASGYSIHGSYKANSSVMRDAWLFTFNWLVTYE